jgi:EAL domain-containing protein (putative c-di-GMP-specific phosphodiesterase class I)
MKKLFYRPVFDTHGLQMKGIHISFPPDPAPMTSDTWSEHFNRACKEVRQFLTEGLPLQFFVFPLDLSPRDVRNIVREVARCLKANQLHPKLVRFEISEKLSRFQLFKIITSFKLLVGAGIRFIVCEIPTRSLRFFKIFKPLLRAISALKIPFDARSKNRRATKNYVDKAHGCGLQVVFNALNEEEDVEISRLEGSDLMEGDYLGPNLQFDEILQWSKLHRLNLA